jgi:hypothetical protein
MHRLSLASFKSTEHIQFAKTKARVPRRSIYSHPPRPSSLLPSSSSCQPSSFLPSEEQNLKPSPFLIPTQMQTLFPQSPGSPRRYFLPSPGFQGLLAPLEQKNSGLERGMISKAMFEKFLLTENSAAGLALMGMGLAILDVNFCF